MSYHPFAPYAGCKDTCPESEVVQIPGPSGSPGAPGPAGTPGTNAFTLTTAPFAMPAGNGSVTVTVVRSDWMAVGQLVYVEGAGYLEVIGIGTTISVWLRNPAVGGAYAGNAAAGTVIPSGRKVTPAGVQGLAGTTNYVTAGDIELDGGGLPRLAITADVGSLVVNTNGLVAPRNTALSPGSDGTILHADSTAPSGHGLQWREIDLSGTGTTLSGVLLVNHGGTAAATAAGARTNLGAAASGANSDITSLSGLTTPLSVGQGGTGVTVIPSFRVDRNGVQQGIQSNTYTKLTFPHVMFNVGLGYDTVNHLFLPPRPGIYRLAASALLVQLAGLQSFRVYIYRNGSILASSPLLRNWNTSTVADVSAAVTVLAEANGTTDNFEAYVFYTDSGSVWKDVSGVPSLTWFEGERVGPATT